MRTCKRERKFYVVVARGKTGFSPNLTGPLTLSFQFNGVNLIELQVICAGNSCTPACHVDRASPGSGRSLCSRVLSRVSFSFWLKLYVIFLVFIFLWSPQEDHCSVTDRWGGGEAIRGWIWKGEMQMDRKSCKWGDEKKKEREKRGGAWRSCAAVCFYASIGTQRLDYALTPKGLNSQSGSLTPSNLFIWWFLICCFSASFHGAGLSRSLTLSVPGPAEKINVQNTSCFANDWPLVAKDVKGHYESN